MPQARLELPDRGHMHPASEARFVLVIVWLVREMEAHLEDALLRRPSLDVAEPSVLANTARNRMPS